MIYFLLENLQQSLFFFQGIHNLQPVHSLSGPNSYMLTSSPSYSFIYPATSHHFIFFETNAFSLILTYKSATEAPLHEFVGTLKIQEIIFSKL